VAEPSRRAHAKNHIGRPSTTLAESPAFATPSDKKLASPCPPLHVWPQPVLTGEPPIRHFARMKLLHNLFAAFQSMPGGLRYATLTCSLLALSGLTLAVSPNGGWFLEGNRVGYGKFWHQGGGVLFAVAGLWSAMLVYGFVRARRWARPAAVVFGWLTVLASFIGWQIFTLDVALAVLLFGCWPTWYFYGRQPVRDYFGISHERRES